MNGEPNSFILELLVSAVDPILLTDPRVKRRVEQHSKKLWQLTVYFNFVIWIFIWLLTIFLNDWSKPNFYTWLQYRVAVISIMIGLFIGFRYLKQVPFLGGVIVFLLAGLQSIAYSWSYSLGLPMPKEFIVVFSALILATCIRSFLLNVVCLGLILFTSRIFWNGYVSPAWVFTDYEIAVFFFMFVSVGYASIFKNRENTILIGDIEAQKVKQEQEFYEQLLSFVSPTIVKTLALKRRPDQSLPDILDHLMKRRRIRLSLLYCDWRGFSLRADNLDFIEQELIPSTANIIDNCEKNGGIARQTADAILTFFPTVDFEESLLLAMKSGIEALIYEKQRRTSTLPDRYFIITSGNTLIGNMASKSHREFAIVGKPANKSQRIDELTKKEPLKGLINQQECLILDSDSLDILLTFSPGFLVKKIILAELGLTIRSYEQEPYVGLFELCDKNIVIINELLKINSHSPIGHKVGI